MYEFDINNKLRSEDRVFILAPIEGKNTITNSGLVDNRLFTGTNKLHAIMDPQTLMWSLKFEKGIVPAPLKQKFTKFSLLEKFVRDYFKARNIEVKEIID